MPMFAWTQNITSDDQEKLGALTPLTPEELRELHEDPWHPAEHSLRLRLAHMLTKDESVQKTIKEYAVAWQDLTWKQILLVIVGNSLLSWALLNIVETPAPFGVDNVGQEEALLESDAWLWALLLVVAIAGYYAYRFLPGYLALRLNSVDGDDVSLDDAISTIVAAEQNDAFVLGVEPTPRRKRFSRRSQDAFSAPMLARRGDGWVLMPSMWVEQAPETHLREKAMLEGLVGQPVSASPHVQTMHTISVAGRHYHGSEKLSGDLAQLIKDHGHRLSYEQLLSICGQIVRGVADLHDSGVCLADLKPENIFWGYDPKHGVYDVRISDYLNVSADGHYTYTLDFTHVSHMQYPDGNQIFGELATLQESLVGLVRSGTVLSTRDDVDRQFVQIRQVKRALDDRNAGMMNLGVLPTSVRIDKAHDCYSLGMTLLELALSCRSLAQVPPQGQAKVWHMIAACWQGVGAKSGHEAQAGADLGEVLGQTVAGYQMAVV